MVHMVSAETLETYTFVVSICGYHIIFKFKYE